MASNEIAQHQMTIADIVTYAAMTVGGVVGGVVTNVLRFSARMKALEASVATLETSTADIAKMREELAAHQRDVNASLGAAKADPVQIRMVVDASVREAIANALPAAVGSATQVLRDQVTRLEANHGTMARDVDRMRNDADRAEREGAERWTENARTMGKLEALIRTT